MKVAGLQKVSTIDYLGDVEKKLEIFSFLVYSIKNHGVSDTHDFSWTFGEGGLV